MLLNVFLYENVGRGRGLIKFNVNLRPKTKDGEFAQSVQETLPKNKMINCRNTIYFVIRRFGKRLFGMCL